MCIGAFLVYSCDMEREQQNPTERFPGKIETPAATESGTEQRGLLLGRLQEPLASLANLESGRARPGNLYDAMVRRPSDVVLYSGTDRLRRQSNALIDQLNASRPPGTVPLRRFHEDEAAMKAVDRLAVRRQINILKHQSGIPIAAADEVRAEEIAAAVQAYEAKRGYGDPAPANLRESAREALEDWKTLEDAWEELGIGASAEAAGAGPEGREAETRRRSFQNMRERVRSFIEEVGRVRYRERRDRDVREPVPYAGVAAEAVRRIKDRLAEEAGAAVDLVYYEQPDDVPKLFESSAIKQISELPEADQARQRKSEWKDLDQILRERKEVESALGWTDVGPVYHLVAQTDRDMRRPGGPADNYGAIGFVIDQAKLGVEPTFTEGDSLNPAPLPGFYPHERGGAAVLRRAVTREHLPLANAVLEEGRQMVPDKLHNMLRYIEAQVGGVSGSDLFAAVREVVINTAVLDANDRHVSEAVLAKNRAERERVQALCAERGIPVRYVP